MAPVVALQAEIASPEDKQYLANALFHLRIPPSGNLDSDVRQLAKAIDACVFILVLFFVLHSRSHMYFISLRLVEDLGLRTDLAAYDVPTVDLPDIAAKALGSAEHPHFAKVVNVLESIHPGAK